MCAHLNRDKGTKTQFASLDFDGSCFTFCSLTSGSSIRTNFFTDIINFSTSIAVTMPP